MKSEVRVRFAPSPTGFMHLGNIRTALINYLFAHKKDGKFVVRIEDTDVARNISETGYEILDDLKWLGLKYNEGPLVGGEFGPYYQSKRKDIYCKNLDDLISSQKVYRCFCSVEILDRKRKEQAAQGKPPRYDRTCLHLSDNHIKQKLAAGLPFIWRFKINNDQVLDIKDMARGTIRFDMKNFSDFALTRQDGSFTFMFANFVDDWLMQISHVIRGEDHLSNTAMQAALFDAFAVQIPTFWHLPMLCSPDGKKMSKRDFGFSLEDLKKDGFLPQAICNYLGIVGGSFEKEIQNIWELSQNYDFDNIHATGPIKFDIEKLTWINHKWIEDIAIEKLVEMVKPFLYEQIPASKNIDDEKLAYLLSKVKTDLKVLKDAGKVLEFYFQTPKVDVKELEEQFTKDNAKIILDLIKKHLDECDKTDFFLDVLKKEGKEKGLKVKEIFWTLRYLLTGTFQGVGVHDLFEMLEDNEIKKRLGV